MGLVYIPMARWLLLVCSAALAWSAPAQPDFRQVTWGMNQTQVRAAESGKPSDVHANAGEVIVTYDSIKLAGLTSRLIYIFANDKLVRAKYLFDAKHGDPDDFIADFKIVEPVLREKYGKPVSERAFWQDDDHQTERQAYLEQDRATPADILPSDAFIGMTLAAGHLKLYTQWETDRTKVLHGLTGENNRITHQIEYRGAEFEKFEDEVRRSATGGR